MNKSIMLVAFASLALTACATHSQGVPYGQMQPAAQQPLRCAGPEFSLAESRNSSQSWTGTVIAMQDITIVRPYNATGSKVVGGVVGGALGAGIGSQIGGGSGKKLATGVLGVLGAAAGAGAAENGAARDARVPGVMLRVRLTDGTNRVFTYQQVADPCTPFAKGMPVIVTQLPHGYFVSPL